MAAPVTKDQIVQSLDLLRIVVREKVELDKDDYGLCPFHDDKGPSFHLFTAKSGRARFHCFGCGENTISPLRIATDRGYGRIDASDYPAKLMALAKATTEKTEQANQFTPAEVAQLKTDVA